MGDGFRGTSIEQDGRFSDKDMVLLKTTVFPSTYARRVDLARVDMGAIRRWATARLTELLGTHDEIVIEYVIQQLAGEGSGGGGSSNTVDPRRMQIQLTPFLDADAPAFMQQLWDLLLEAQEAPNGIPQSLVEQTATVKVEPIAPPEPRDRHLRRHRTRSRSRSRSRSPQRRHRHHSRHHHRRSRSRSRSRSRK
jgi:serine/arginine repetitive matrix protein 1